MRARRCSQCGQTKPLDPVCVPRRPAVQLVQGLLRGTPPGQLDSNAAVQPR
jgi:hypothetical protein